MNHSLLCISPIDGRYNNRTNKLSKYFSEKALITYRLHVEIEYLIYLLDKLDVDISKDRERFMNFKLCVRNIYKKLKIDNLENIKEIEKRVNHDVKAIEIYIRNRLEESKYNKYNEYVHFGLTSQDINSTSYMLSMHDANKEIIIPYLNKLLNILDKIIIKYQDIPMLSRTHGQPASPTILGKEINVFTYRLNKQLKLLESYKYSTKFGGAVGNFNSHQIAYPNIDWSEAADEFINNFGFERNKITTQIDIYDNYSELFDILRRISIILLDLSRDMWLYISQDYFKQKCIEDEVGSSTMPHKINPINFENAEGNLMLVTTLFDFMSQKLPVSRLQRDLSDSTVMRNIGSCYAYLLISIISLIDGFKRIEPNLGKIKQELNDNQIILAEAIQSILRREGVENSYDIIKNITRDKTFSKTEIITIIENNLKKNNKDKIIKEINNLDVNTYVGIYKYEKLN